MKQQIRNAIRRIRNFLIPLVVAYLGLFLLNLLIRTCKIKIDGIENLELATADRSSLLMLWHNRIALVPYIGERYAPSIPSSIVVSNSRDGKLLTRIAKRFPNCRAIQVAHNAKHQGLIEMIEHLEERRAVVITPDGPRGPRYRIKKGVLRAAKETAAPILPLSWCASRFWQLSTWDKMIFPKPFSTIYIQFGKTLSVEQTTEPEDLEKIMEDLDQTLYKKAFASKDLWPD